MADVRTVDRSDDGHDGSGSEDGKHAKKLLGVGSACQGIGGANVSEIFRM